jgi:DNA-directed RNA polymerase subunit RPC12/RpoP
MKGRFKYICDDCQAVNWLLAKERIRRTKPRCIECGSIRLSPSSGSSAAQKLGEWHQKKYGRDEMQDKKRDLSSDYSVDNEFDDA